MEALLSNYIGSRERPMEIQEHILIGHNVSGYIWAKALLKYNKP